MSVNNDNFLIEQDDISFAQDICNSIADDSLRNRAMADVVAAKIAEKYFQDETVDTVSGIHNIPEVLSDIDISDIYVRSNYIDVRIYFDENHLEIPKKHFDLNILPVAYMFIKLEEDLSSGSVTGFIIPEDIDTGRDENGYYLVNEDMFKPFYDVEARFMHIDEEGINLAFEKNIFEYLDGTLSDLQAFYKTLLTSTEARKYLISAAAAKSAYEKFDYSSVSSEENTFSEIEEHELPEVGDSTDIELTANTEDLESLIPEEGSWELTETEPSILEEINSTGLEEFDSLDSIDTLSEDAEDSRSLEEDAGEAEESLFGNTDENDGLTAFEDSNISIDLPEDNTEIQPDENEKPEEDFVTEQDIEELEIANDSEIPTENTITEENDDFEELTQFDYSTEIMPSISTIEAVEDTDTNTDSDEVATEEIPEVNESAEPAPEENEEHQKDQQLDTLFNEEPQEPVNPPKKKSSPITILGLIVLLCAAGYFGYTKYFQGMHNIAGSRETSSNLGLPAPEKAQEKAKEPAMPIETVENNEIPNSVNEAAPVSIPAIEQNLNASIEVSNLAVNWEVPISYTNNTTAKRYFVRIGKILQLNLKTELLTLSSPPITNKITIELEFNKDTNKFDISKIINSSGVEKVDTVIKDTVNRILGMNMNMNMSIFNTLQGNPILVIKL